MERSETPWRRESSVCEYEARGVVWVESAAGNTLAHQAKMYELKSTSFVGVDYQRI